MAKIVSKESKEISRLVIEKVLESKFVRTRYESDGHDCWGNNESTQYKYVLINGKQKDVYDGWYILHNDEVILELSLIQNLPESIQKYMDKGVSDRLKEERYKRYLILKDEFEKDVVYIRDQKISKIVG